MTPPVDLSDQQEVLSASPGEMVLFIAGGLLTLVVIAFVAWLMFNAIREERLAGSEEDAKERSDRG
ncbi:MAG: hypothetical protein CMJ34_10675 [Phycisphaerae bacterium]|nr:hypothetical protein [Phycisphaerae bacterium]